jgi:hypothetical protein
MPNPIVAPLLSPALPVAPTRTPLNAFRTRLCAEQDRDWTYFNTYDGSLASSWKIGGQAYTPFLIPAVQLYYDSLYHGGYRLPANTPAGTLTVDCGRGIETTLTAIAPPARKATTIAAGSTAAQVNAAIAAGYLDVTLAAGLHQWEQMVSLPANVILRGHGATVQRLPLNNYGTNWPCVLVTGQDVSIYGITWINDNPGGMVLLANPTQAGLVVGDCAIRRCNLGFYFSGALIRDCVFDGGGAIPAPGGMYLRCHWIGPSVNMDPWQFWAGLGSVQMVDCIFDKTQRGPVFNAGGGTISDCLFAGVECHDIVCGNNGDECWLCEGGALTRMVCLHCRVIGCDSATFQFTSGGSAILVRDFVQDGGAGVQLDYADNSPTTGFTLEDFELRRCGIYCGSKATGNQFLNGSVIDFQPTRYNQAFQNTSKLSFQRTVAVLINGPGNTLTGVATLGMAPGMTGVQQFTASTN